MPSPIRHKSLDAATDAKTRSAVMPCTSTTLLELRIDQFDIDQFDGRTKDMSRAAGADLLQQGYNSDSS